MTQEQLLKTATHCPSDIFQRGRFIKTKPCCEYCRPELQLKTKTSPNVAAYRRKRRRYNALSNRQDLGRLPGHLVLFP